ncbi:MULTISPECIES: TetR/AcrR family transcriptional regulator [Paenibacillus]|uniref:Transcriptional regulator, TetR family n=2 Tax=Paenibacillus lactis TaxID=228574 RepID=G4HQ05_9BACL|nr:TetR/AcrR family transcriptional regulator [Paenibacillus lactis]EHB46484.1 transcriptional regulator, TetR family [Paenibacillus lactis 154]MBP1896105.1 AcrR family transcriptional regulator [Paenibacillus lactis]HAF99937.1 TetR/AcrR family transcriptional regulator [Paenibacillus lactis]
MKKGEETKQSILEHGLRLFSSKGYEETSLKDIASCVNIKTPSIYAYFSSKDELFEKIVDFVIDDYVKFIEHQASTMESLSIKDQLYNLLEKLNKYYYMNDRGIFLKRYGVFPPEKFKEHIFQNNSMVESEIRKLIYTILDAKSEDHKFIDRETIATSFICLLDGMLFYLMNCSYEEYERRLESTWKVFWKGILE